MMLKLPCTSFLIAQLALCILDFDVRRPTNSNHHITRGGMFLKHRSLVAFHPSDSKNMKN